MSEQAIKGFPVNGGVAQYDFNSLANLPEALKDVPTANVGQVLVVEAVDASGKITKVVASDFIVDRVDDIILPSANWEQVSNEEYAQELAVATVTSNTYVSIAPDDAAILDMQERHLTLRAKNVGGKVVVTATGDRPVMDYTVQIKLEEVVWL